MTELDILIAKAFASEGKPEDANKVYATLLRSSLFLPTSKDKPLNQDEPFQPLFAEFDGKYFMMVFDTLERLQNWAGDHMQEMSYAELIGHDIIHGLGKEVFLCLNYGTEYYKEFSPDEIKKLKSTVVKLDEWAAKRKQ